MCSLGMGDQSDWRRLSRWSRFSEFHLDAVVAQELHHRSPMKAPLPVSPHNGMRGGKWRRERRDLLGCIKWPEHRTHSARFFGGRPIALTLLTPRAGTAVTEMPSRKLCNGERKQERMTTRGERVPSSDRTSSLPLVHSQATCSEKTALQVLAHCFAVFLRVRFIRKPMEAPTNATTNPRITLNGTPIEYVATIE